MNTEFLASLSLSFPAFHEFLERVDYTDLALVTLGLVMLIVLRRVSALRGANHRLPIERKAEA